ncbi:MAG: 4,5-DOPA dioxygenase extradiol [Bacteroidota bacterium]
MESEERVPLMPMIFVGHGSPTNAIEENEFTRGWRKAALSIPRPTAILCISAHWETVGTRVSAAEKPHTIHDFGGFAKELYEVSYPAKGSLELVKNIRTILTKTMVIPEPQQGLDHGCWVPLMKMFPEADIPVVQLSLDIGSKPAKHYELAKRLEPLRRQGVLIIGSGNMVHNLRKINISSFDNINLPSGYDWAFEMNDLFKEKILSYDHEPLIHFENLGKSGRYAIPSPEHFLPLLYILALQQEDEAIDFFNDVIVAGSLSMTSVLVGK